MEAVLVDRLIVHDVGLALQARVSVIIPTYCRSDDLSELLDSLLVQSVKPLEIIVVDDSPSPSIKHLCKKYEKKFKEANVTIAYVKNSRERSIAIARNIGGKMAKGDFLMFFDDDVVLHPDYINEVLKTFERCPEALAVAGWIVPSPVFVSPIHYFSDNTLRKVFFLWHDSKDSCKYAEYPTVLTKTTSVSWSSGSNVAVKRSVFSEFQFDENLKDYSYMEDVLFSASIHNKHPNGLVMTPNAKCVHKVSKKARLTGSKLRLRAMQNRKYVLKRLFGSKGLLMFGWQNAGLLIYRLIAKVRKWEIVAIG